VNNLHKAARITLRKKEGIEAFDRIWREGSVQRLCRAVVPVSGYECRWEEVLACDLAVSGPRGGQFA